VYEQENQIDKLRLHKAQADGRQGRGSDKANAIAAWEAIELKRREGSSNQVRGAMAPIESDKPTRKGEHL